MALLGALVVWPGQDVTSLLGMLCLSAVNRSESILSYLTGRTLGLLEHKICIELLKVSSLIFYCVILLVIPVDKRLVIAERPFSNSLLIHQVKTKKITIAKEVWIPGLN